MHTQSHSKHARSHILLHTAFKPYTQYMEMMPNKNRIAFYFLSFLLFVRMFGRYIRTVRSDGRQFVWKLCVHSKQNPERTHNMANGVRFGFVIVISRITFHLTTHTHIHTCIHTETPIHSDARTHARSFNHSLIHSRMHAHIPQIHGKVKPKFMHSYKSIPLACLLASLILLGHSIEVYLARQSDDAQWYYHSVVYMCVQYATYKQQQQQQNFYLGANRFVFLFLRLLCDIRFYVAVELNISEQMRQPLSQANNSCFVFHWIQRRKNHWMPKYKNDYKKKWERKLSMICIDCCLEL